MSARNWIKAAIFDILNALDLRIMRASSFNKLLADAKAVDDLNFLSILPEGIVGKVVKLLPLSQSQLRQDLFILIQSNFLYKGYFVEFGAADGKGLSNTYLLEKEFGWEGILAEPARIWREALRNNRSASLEFDCVWRETGKKVIFNEVSKAELSTISEFTNVDHHPRKKNKTSSYMVDTISLQDMLDKHNAPKRIDYLSIDTEGSEYDILSTFDFDAYDIRMITCEHNYTSAREKIHNLLSANGFTRKHEEFSKFDDWYIKKD